MSRGVSIKSPNAAVFVQNGQSFSESDLDVVLYKLVQNFSYSVSLPRQELKQLGKLLDEHIAMSKKIEEIKKKEKIEERKQIEFTEKIDELNQETDTLLEEIDKWQM